MLIEDLLCLLHRIASCQGILVVFFFFPKKYRFSFREISFICPFISTRADFLKIIIIFDIYKEICAINYEMK